MREQGFTLVELAVTTALTFAVLSVVLTVSRTPGEIFAVRSEMADMRQRLRVAGDALQRDLAAAGNGLHSGGLAGPLQNAFAPVLPRRPSLDPPATFRSDVVTVYYVPGSSAQAALAVPMLSGSGAAVIDLAAAACSKQTPSCGLAAGMAVAVFDGSGGYDLFTIRSASGPALSLGQLSAGMASYPAGSRVTELITHTYSVEVDRAGVPHLQRSAAAGASVPVVDHVAALAFEYFGDPAPPLLRRPLTDPAGGSATYGPLPPPAGVRSTGYPAGENCLFRIDEAGNHQPRLASLGDGFTTAPVRLSAAQLTDGPWCPDDASPGRYDADLFRVRSIGVRIRVQAALAMMRGPAGALFARGGSARYGPQLAPDVEVSLRISPPNLRRQE